MRELSIIVVNFNTKQLLKRCLTSLLRHVVGKSVSPEIIVIDNASSDDSVMMIQQEFPTVKLIINKQNRGFAKANNQGLKIAQGKYILLLNSDTEFLDGSLTEALKFMDQNKKVGVIGCKLLNTDGTIQYSTGYFPTLSRVFFWMLFLDDLPILNQFFPAYHLENLSFYEKNHEVDWVSGAFLLVRVQVVKQVGGLDEKIFMYGEEVEWCYRIKHLGFSVYYFSETAITHFKGRSASGGTAGLVEEFLSLKYFYAKYRDKFSQLLLRLLLKTGIILRLILFGIIAMKSEQKRIYEKAYQLV